MRIGIVQRHGNKLRPVLYLVFFAMIGISMFGMVQSGTYTIYNDIQGTMTIYADDNTELGVPDREVLSDGDRIFTVMQVDVELTSADGLDYIKAYLFVENSDGTKGNLMTSAKLTEVDSLAYQTTFDVNGYGTGYYILHLDGVPLTHPEEVTNPDWIKWKGNEPRLEPDEDASTSDVYQTWLGDEPPETITEQKDDVDIFLPDDQRVYIRNPDEAMQVSLSVTDTNGVFTFDFQVLEGSLKGATMVIYHENYDNRVLETTDINALVFNKDRGQTDGEYIAKVYYTGNIGWTGGSVEKTFTVDNPDEISAISTIYIMENGVWVEPVDVLKGDIKIEASSVTGNPSRIWVEIVGPITKTYDLSTSGDVYQVVIDTRELVNGVYDIQLKAEREEDGATCFLSAWSMDSTSGTQPTMWWLLILGVSGIAVLVITDERIRRRL